MISFSVNTNIYDKMDKIVKLNLNPKNQKEQEWLSEAYIKILDGESYTESFNLSAFARVCEKNSNLARAKQNNIYIISDDEFLAGYHGITDLVSDYVDNSIDKITYSADLEQYVNEFISMREYIYLEEGKDLWRLLELSCMDNKKAQRKLRVLFDTYDYLKELVENIIRAPKGLANLKYMLA